MAFVSGYEQDVFISYAHVDDEPAIPDDQTTRWVSILRQALQTRLDRKIGAVTIWMDRGGLEGNEPVTPRIRQAVTRSATLVIVFSPGYLRSPWCQQERDLFIQGAGGVGAAIDRIFLVRLDDIPRIEWPHAFTDSIGYPFYTKDPVTGVVKCLADPKPDAQEKAYWTELNKLCTEMARKLASLGTLGAPALAVTPGPVTNSRQTVFLAETTQALYADREAIAAFLTDLDYEVCPNRFYNRDPLAFTRAMDVDLARAALFVQLLGSDCSLRTDELPNGYEGLQLERARAAGRPLLRWRRQDLDLASIRDAHYQQFLQNVDVIAMDLEDLKAEIVRLLQQQVVRQELGQSNGETSVLIKANAQDLQAADALGNELKGFQVNFNILSESLALAEVVASEEYNAEEYNAVMVVYGICPQEWVQQQARVLRQLILSKKAQAPRCAVYIAPTSLHQKEPLRFWFQSLQVIDGSTLGTFVHALLRP